MGKQIRPGIYRHFKGNYYRLLSVVRSSEDESQQVVYQALYGDCGIWVRPYEMWNELVEKDGQKVRRFEYVEENKLDFHIDKIALIYIKDGKVLMARSKGKEKIYFPGGKREIGEHDVETLVREIKEELNVDVDKKTVTHYGTYYSHRDGKIEEKLMKMTCYIAELKGKLAPSNEIDEICWLTYKDRNKTNGVGLIIFDELYQKGLIKF